MKLSDIVPENAIVPELSSTKRDDVLTELVDALIASGVAEAGDRDAILSKLIEREKKGSTGFGRGVAVPHVKHGSIERMAAAVGLSQRGIDFDALDRQPVYSIFLLLSPEDKPEEHLQAMEIIFKSLSADQFRRFLRQASTVEEVRTLLEEAEQTQPPG